MSEGSGGNHVQGRSDPRGRVRTLVAASCVVAGALAAAIAGVTACLADLPPVPDGGAEPVTLAPPVCGDGVIQRDAGEACDPGDSGAPGCSADCTAVDCPAPAHLSATGDHCYFALAPGKPSAAAATNACADAGAHLVTFNGNAERQRVDEAGVVPGGLYWVGLSLETPADRLPVYDAVTANEPGWRSTCSGCYGPMFPASTVSYFPDVCPVKGVISLCVAHAAAANEAFFGFDCTGSCVPGDAGAVATVGTLCEREPPGLSGQACDDGAVCITLGSNVSTSFYELVTVTTARAQAQAACAAKVGPSGKPGHLVIFETADEREQLSGELVARTSAGLPQLTYWVGLANAARTSAPAWTWDDGNAAAAYPLEWADGEPTGGAVAYGLVAQEGSGAPFDRQLLHADPGTEPRAYVCEFDGP